MSRKMRCPCSTHEGNKYSTYRALVYDCEAKALLVRLTSGLEQCSSAVGPRTAEGPQAGPQGSESWAESSLLLFLCCLLKVLSLFHHILIIHSLLILYQVLIHLLSFAYYIMSMPLPKKYVPNTLKQLFWGVFVCHFRVIVCCECHMFHVLSPLC
jgi:hypothetical protein